MLTFGQRLKLISKEAGLTQSELAEQLMVNVQTVSKWECDTSMPDISQIVPLASLLDVTTDCLLGVGGNEKEDRENLYEEIGKAFESSSNRSYEDCAARKAYVMCVEHIKKYPLDYQVRMSLVYEIQQVFNRYKRGNFDLPSDEEERLYNEGVKHLIALSNQAHDPDLLIRAKRTLVEFYIYGNEIEKAEAAAIDLPDIYDVKSGVLLRIYNEKKDYDKCLKLAEGSCMEFCFAYLAALETRARRISIFGNVRKLEAIAAWRDLEKAARCNHDIIKSENTFGWVLCSLWHRSNDCIAISDFDGALTAIEEMRDFGVEYYNERKNTGADNSELQGIKNAMQSNLKRGYSFSLGEPDNIIDRDPRFRKCQEDIEALN